MAGEEPITAWQRWAMAYDVARDNYSSSTVTSTSTSASLDLVQNENNCAKSCFSKETSFYFFMPLYLLYMDNISSAVLNPILYTAWLNNHALTLKSNTAKYYFDEKTSFFLPS
jgi:hypothetical protein